MTEISIDSSNLPRVKEVCRDFAVLEDHSLAHTLQEQEIEHHLATNIQRNRLVKKDLQVAKQLQEEEDLKAQAKVKHRHDELELLDGEIAQEIQDKLVIEAERRRRQEEKDEDIARLLQEKEERRRRKHYPPHGAEEPYYPDHEAHHRGRRKEHEYDRHHRHEKHERSRKEGGHPKPEQPSYYDDDRKRGRSAEPRSVQRDHNAGNQRPNHGRTSANKEKPQRPPPPQTSRHEVRSDEAVGASSSRNVARKVRSHSHDLLSTDSDDVRRHRHSPSSRSDKQRTEKEKDNERHRRRTPSHNERLPRDGGYRAKGHRDDPQGRLGKSRDDDDDAKIARKLQEEELRVNTVDYKTAQMAQDEEIARWLMEKEEKSYRKTRGRDKLSDRRREDELEANAHGRPRSKDEHHRSKSDKPYRPLPPPPDEDYNGEYSHDNPNRSYHSSPHSSSKSAHSQKGSYYKQ
ncbi:coiled-coil domain-containing protein 50 [Gastrophryne carolinensis]